MTDPDTKDTTKDTKDTGEVFEVPQDLGGLTDTDLRDLHDQAGAHFDTIHGDGNELSDDDIDALEALATSLEQIQAELAKRDEAATERAERAAQLAAKVRPSTAAEETPGEEGTDTEGEDGDNEDTEGDTGGETGDPDTEQADQDAEVLVASPRGSTRVPMSRVRSRASRKPPARQPADSYAGLSDIMTASVDGKTFTAGQGIGWQEAAGIVDRNLAGYKPGMYEAAARTNRHLSQSYPIATLTRPKPADLVINSNDPDEIERVMKRAVDEAKTPHGSLVASGGWCAPSETYYDLTEMEGRDGLLSMPEIRVTRGGFKRTLGPDFADLFALGHGFVYTEEQDIAGNYGTDEFGIGDGSAGSKPCVRIPCTEWEEFRLGVDGLCIVAGLLMQKGYPELIARTIRGVLVAHDHIQSGRYIKRLVDGSDPVTMPTPPGGAIAPLLEAIELQVEHMRSIRRIPRNVTFEAKFPMWVHSLIRSDLAKRENTDLLNVTDAQINAWFSSRKISAQFLYNWQDIGGAPEDFTGWPQEVQFLLYPAGTWVKAGDDIINLSNLMDSTLLGQNDYVALFTEESWLVAKMGFDSRVVTVPVCANGTYAAPVEFPCPPGPTVTTTTTTV